jgi:hypothetical protein
MIFELLPAARLALARATFRLRYRRSYPFFLPRFAFFPSPILAFVFPAAPHFCLPHTILLTPLRQFLVGGEGSAKSYAAETCMGGGARQSFQALVLGFFAA